MNYCNYWFEKIELYNQRESLLFPQKTAFIFIYIPFLLMYKHRFNICS